MIDALMGDALFWLCATVVSSFVGLALLVMIVRCVRVAMAWFRALASRWRARSFLKGRDYHLQDSATELGSRHIPILIRRQSKIRGQEKEKNVYEADPEGSFLRHLDGSKKWRL